MNSPKVSVVTITYGHEKYITDTLDGVLMQQYDGPIEFIIANDNSPDKTDEVVKKYFAEHAVPDNFEINYTRHEINKGMNHNFIWAAQQATGKYIAMCEGDDYWIDPLKLQKQVDFLEENGEYVICGHWKVTIDEFGKFIIPREDKKSEIKDLSTQCVCYRNFCFNDKFYNYAYTVKNLGETYIYHFLSQFGKSKILHFHGAAYRLSKNGVYGMIGIENQIKQSLRGCSDMQAFFIEKSQKAIFDRITIRKAYFLNDYSLYLLKQKKIGSAIRKNVLLNKELTRLSISNLIKTNFVKINLFFYYKCFTYFLTRK